MITNYVCINTKPIKSKQRRGKNKHECNLGSNCFKSSKHIVYVGIWLIQALRSSVEEAEMKAEKEQGSRARQESHRKDSPETEDVIRW
jgi:hypothetical protein